jgi:thiol peroxidase
MKTSSLNKLLFTSLLISSFLTFNVQAANQDSLNQSQNLVKANNKYVTLLGTQVAVNDLAPNFKVVDKNFTPVELSDFKDQTVLISVVPSLDTGICSIQTKRFNDEASKLPSNITILTISNDLPFAQKRFCKVENVDQIKVLSDSVWRDFGEKYGLIIKDMGLLTRAIFIVDPQGKVKYKELVKNISQHPDYTTALKAVRDIAPILVVDPQDNNSDEDNDNELPDNQ